MSTEEQDEVRLESWRGDYLRTSYVRSLLSDEREVGQVGPTDELDLSCVVVVKCLVNDERNVCSVDRLNCESPKRSVRRNVSRRHHAGDRVVTYRVISLRECC